MTRQQSKLLAFVRDCITNDGEAPTYLEMQVATGLASKSGVSRLLVALEGYGHIRRIPGQTRGIELVDAATVHIPASLLSHLREAAARNQVGVEQLVLDCLSTVYGPAS